MLLLRHYKRCLVTRTFLSDAFDCRAAWNERLAAPIFAKVEMHKYFLELDRQFTREGRGSAVDVDIFSNATLLSPEEELSSSDKEIRIEQLGELLRRFRKTEQTGRTLESTHHAAIRAYVDAGSTDILLTILADRVNYGIFPDDFSYAYLLDLFAKQENWRDASKVAILLMHQEEFNVPLVSELAVYSCYKYAREMKTSQLPWLPIPPVVPEEPEEEVKVWVEIKENDYFDDHFDLTKREHLVGKTLVKFAQLSTHLKQEPVVQKSLQLIGNVLYEKWDSINENDTVAKEVLTAAIEHVNDSELESKEGLIEKLSKLNSTDFDVEAFLKKSVESSVAQHEQEYIGKQVETYKVWNKTREDELDRQYQLYLKNSKIQQLDQKKKTLQEQEERLFFFDNYEAMEKAKRAKFVEWRKTWPKRTWANLITLRPREFVQDDYVPPDVKKSKN